MLLWFGWALVWNWCGWFTILGFLRGLGDSVCLYCLIAGGMMSFDSWRFWFCVGWRDKLFYGLVVLRCLGWVADLECCCLVGFGVGYYLWVGFGIV